MNRRLVLLLPVPPSVPALTCALLRPSPTASRPASECPTPWKPHAEPRWDVRGQRSARDVPGTLALLAADSLANLSQLTSDARLSTCPGLSASCPVMFPGSSSPSTLFWYQTQGLTGTRFTPQPHRERRPPGSAGPCMLDLCWGLGRCPGSRQSTPGTPVVVPTHLHLLLRVPSYRGFKFLSYASCFPSWPQSPQSRPLREPPLPPSP